LLSNKGSEAKNTVGINAMIGDITKIEVDAVVNAANTSLLGGGGVDGAIHKAAGKELLDECRKLNGCKVGEAKLTKGHLLPAKFIIHTVGPVWNGGSNNEEETLKNCYANCLKLAVQNKIKSIAFPCISTGRFHFPIEKAARIAVQAARNAIADGNITDIYFVCFDEQNFNEYEKVLNTEGILFNPKEG
jgi:Predicted phosphatase homologous to the C-terminal domain of histone macroH2A1